MRLRFKNRDSSAVRVEQLRRLVAERGYRHLPLDRLRIRQTGRSRGVAATRLRHSSPTS